MTTPLVLVVAGTRPELQKLASVVAALRADGIPTAFLWTGQHSDAAMTTAFAAGCHWPEPTDRLEWRPGFPVEMAREIRLWWAARHGAPPAMVLVQGDTDSGRVGALAVACNGWKGRTLLAHLEAGLRSWEPDLPEERNRREIDRNADLLLCPSVLAAAQARVDAKENAKIVVTGQTGLDALHAAIERGPPGGSPVRLDAISNGRKPGERRWVHPWALLTLHRAALADDPEMLALVAGVASGAAKRSGLRLVWPVHPRVRARQPHLVRHAKNAGVSVVDPLPYRTLASLLGSERTEPDLVISDSGGLVEESCYLGIPTIILRPATERWELVARGDAELVRPDLVVHHLADAVARAVANQGPRTPGVLGRGASPYGNPRGARALRPTARVVAAVREALGPLIPGDSP